MRKLLGFFLLLSTTFGYSQTIVPRSNASNTIQDSRLDVKLNLGIPTYQDTVEANLPANRGLDKGNEIIKTRVPDKLWVRQFVPRRWFDLTGVGGGGGGSPATGSNGLTGVNGDVRLGGTLVNPTIISAGSNQLSLSSTASRAFEVKSSGNAAGYFEGQNVGLSAYGAGVPIFAVNPSTVNYAVAGIIQSAGTSGMPGVSGMGVSFKNQLLSSTGAVALASEQITSWVNNPTATSGQARYEIKLAGGAGNYLTRFQIDPNGQINFPAYTSATSFPGTQVAQLGLDAQGNLITVAPGTGGGTGNNPLVFDDGKVHLKAFGAGTQTTLAAAIAIGKTVVIDTNLVISASYTTPQLSHLEFLKGFTTTTTNSAQFTIGGQFEAGAYQIFNVAANVKARPTSVLEIYPEWFGGYPLVNPRKAWASITVGGAEDNTAALKKAFTFIEGGEYLIKTFNPIMRFRGMYTTADQIDINSGYRIQGNGQDMQGSGLRWIGPGNPAKSMLRFLQAEFGGVDRLAFIGPGSTSDANLLKSAIEVTWNGGIDTERGMVFSNLMFGNVMGYYAGINTSGYSFRTAILCSGSSGNNDFHTFDDIQVADTKIGIETETDQSVEWRINNYRMNFGQTMYKSHLGGSVNGKGWYTHGTGEGDHAIIEVLGSVSQELRMSLEGFSSEYMYATSFIKTEAVMKFNLQGQNFISVNPNFLDANDGFGLITGGAANFGSYSFTNTRFEYGDDGEKKSPGFVNATPRMYIDNPATTNILTKVVTFQNCTGVRALSMKYPTAGGAALNFTHLTVQGERMGEPSIDSNWYQSDVKIALNAFDPRIIQGTAARWLPLTQLFNGQTEVIAKTIAYGEKGRTTLSTMDVKGYRTLTTNSPINIVPKVLPARSIIKGVSAITYSSNILPDFLHYVTVGTIKNDRLFGTIPVPNGFQRNNITAAVYVTDTAEPLIFKGWVQYQQHFIYTLSGSTVSVGYNAFEPSMVGGVFRFLTGTLANKEFIITGYTSPTSVTVGNPLNLADATGGRAEMQTPLTADKEINITITSESTSKYEESVNYGLQSQLPLIPAIAKTPVANETQFLYGGIDTTGFGGGGGGGSGGAIGIATSTAAGIVKVGDNMTMANDGKLSFNEGNVVHRNGDENIFGLKTFDQLQTAAVSPNTVGFRMSSSANTGQVNFKMVNDATKEGNIFMMNSGYSPAYGALKANDFAFYTGNVLSDVVIMAENGNSRVKLAAGNNLEKFGLGLNDITATIPITGVAATADNHLVTFKQMRDSIAAKLVGGGGGTTPSNFAVVIPGGTGASTFTSKGTDTLIGKRLTILGENVTQTTNNDSALVFTIAPRVATVVSATTITPDLQFNDAVKVLSLASDATIANPTGTATGFRRIMIRIKDNGVSRVLTFGSLYRAIGVTIPTATVAGKVLYIEAIYNGDENFWDVVRVNQQL